MRKKKLSDKQKKRKRIVESVNITADLLKYAIIKFEDIASETGVRLEFRGDPTNKKRFCYVVDLSSYGEPLNKGILKKGTIVQCVDFVIMKWKKSGK